MGRAPARPSILDLSPEIRHKGRLSRYLQLLLTQFSSRRIFMQEKGLWKRGDFEAVRNEGRQRCSRNSRNSLCAEMLWMLP